MIGATVGPYRIEAKAGAGGMGVVYRAVDTKLRRPVAIKVLHPAAGADPDRKRRFIQEAQAASALNHSDIVTIYQIGTEGTTDYIAMEFVDGRSLDRVIGGRPLPVKDVLKYAIRIADALGAAHKAGILHRDLKPANVMITDSGGLKLLDFGVAKLTEPADASTTTRIAPPTLAGVAVGTLAYMSPEQMQGTAVDARSDIYSFGLVLFEMLTGHRLQSEFDPALLASTPADLRKIVARCLRREPSERFQLVDDVRHAFEDVDLSPPTATPGAARPRWLRLAMLMFLVTVVAAAGIFLWRTRKPSLPPQLNLTRLTSDPGLTTDPALSADGRLLAFASDRAGNGSLDIWVRQVAGGTPVPVTNDPADDREPTFSPDATQIAFESDREGGGVYVAPTFGGEARRISDRCHRPRWSPKSNQIVCWAGVNTAFLLSKADAPRVYLVSTAGEEPRRVFADFAVAFAPLWSADGAHLLFVGRRRPGDDAEWWIADADGGSARATSVTASVAPSLYPPIGVFVPEVWTSSGHVLFTAGVGSPRTQFVANDNANIWRIRLDTDGHFGVRPERLTSGTSFDTHPTISADGALVFSAIREDLNLWSLPLNAATGLATGPPDRVTDDPAIDAYPSVTPDDSKLLFLSNRSGSFDLWMNEAGKQSVLGTQVSFPSVPTISRDGSTVLFESGTRGRWLVAPTSHAAHGVMARVICTDCGVVWDITSDNRTVLIGRNHDSTIGVRDLSGGNETTILQSPGETIGRVRFSPDDRWLSFTHRSEGTVRVNVAPFSPGTLVARDRWIVVTPENTTSNGPRWSPDGGMLYFTSDRDGWTCVWAAPIDRQTGRPAGDAFAVWHFHDARRSLTNLPLPIRGLAVSRDRVIATVSESAGNLWLAR